MFGVSDQNFMVKLWNMYFLIFRRFRLETQGESGKRLFFHLYHTNHHPGKWEERNLDGLLLFFQNMGVKTTNIRNFAWNYKMNVQWYCFSIYLYHINHPQENGTCMSQHLFSRKMMVKTKKIKF